MKYPERDYSILRHIISYCDQIDATVQRFGDDETVFQNDQIYRNAAALCILQIGELAGTLTQELRTQYPDIPWRQIRAVRNIVVHRYGSVDPVTTWEIIQKDIPALRRQCQEIIQNG